MEDDDEDHYEDKLARRGLSPSPVAARPENTRWSPDRALRRPLVRDPQFGWWKPTGKDRNGGSLILELVMSSKFVQWIVWAVLMALFTALTLAERWTDLALAMTVAAVLWYGIVPAPRSGRQ